MSYSNESRQSYAGDSKKGWAVLTRTGKSKRENNGFYKSASLVLSACLVLGLAGLGQEVMALGQNSKNYVPVAKAEAPAAVVQAIASTLTERVQVEAATYLAQTAEEQLPSKPEPAADLTVTRAAEADRRSSAELAGKAAAAEAEAAAKKQAAEEAAAEAEAAAKKQAAEEAEAEAEAAAKKQAAEEAAAEAEAAAKKQAAEEAAAEAEAAAKKQAAEEAAESEQATAATTTPETQAETTTVVSTAIAIEKVDEVVADVEAKTAEHEAELKRQAAEAERQAFLDKREQAAAELGPDLLKLYLGVVAAECGSTWDYDGCLRVAQVIMNRVDSGHWGDLRGVLTAPNQFTVYSSGAWASKVPTEAQREAALDALAGKKIFADDIIFFCTDAAYARSSYFKRLDHRDTFANTLFFAK